MTDGVVVVDKPAGWTSHDVVARCRRIYGQRRVGHSGTLDPGATGVLLVGLGRATRLLRFLTELPKRYTAELVLGVGTTTLDDDGDVVATADPSGVTWARLEAAATRLTGDILQVPPMVSAVHVGGRRLHELAREGKDVERAPRPVRVHAFALSPTGDPAVWEMDVTCSTGTYVRVLAADVGSDVGVPAHLRRLRRTSIGPFDADQAWSLARVESDPARAVLAPAEALGTYPALVLDGDDLRAVAHGRPLPGDLAGDGDGPWRVLGPAGDLLAMYERRPDGSLRPSVVLAADQ
ncbi:MAG TPA: tRNA pseudouridine(55) synthase TruB [Acidimicrobiales bacterium]|nr:tRNA pseudouridine(55) synthase TruB [Acidimicrobiales bacterium]